MRRFYRARETFGLYFDDQGAIGDLSILENDVVMIVSPAEQPDFVVVLCKYGLREIYDPMRRKDMWEFV